MRHHPKLFRASDQRLSNPHPVYILKEGKLYRTAFHQKGWAEQPDYDFGNDGKFYRTEFHEQGFGKLPDYEFGKDGKIYRTENHPAGGSDTPDFFVQD